jgi:hypothetical protein
MPLPFDLVIYPQPFKQVLIALENLSQGVDEQGFAKSSGAGQEKVLPGMEQPVNMLSFVHIQIASFDQGGETLQSNGKWLFHQDKGKAFCGNFLVISGTLRQELDAGLRVVIHAKALC